MSIRVREGHQLGALEQEDEGGRDGGGNQVGSRERSGCNITPDTGSVRLSPEA